MPDWNVVGVLHHYGVQVGRLNGSGSVKALCPFHDDHEPSLAVDLHRGLFTCYGCGWRGDLFDFVERLEGTRGVDTLLATWDASQSADVEPPPPVGRRFTPEVFRSMVRPCWERVTGAAGYAVRRGIAPEVLRAFRVLWDPVRKMTVFPIRWRGRWVGYQARTLGEGPSKYVFSVGFPRREVLYLSTEYGVEPRHPLLLVEGVFDALRAVTHGWTYVAATFGATLTDQQIAYLREEVRGRVIVCMDGDEAGMQANVVLARVLGSRYVYAMPLGSKDVGGMSRQQFWKTMKTAWEGRNI